MRAAEAPCGYVMQMGSLDPDQVYQMNDAEETLTPADPPPPPRAADARAKALGEGVTGRVTPGWRVRPPWPDVTAPAPA